MTTRYESREIMRGVSQTVLCYVSNLNGKIQPIRLPEIIYNGTLEYHIIIALLNDVHGTPQHERYPSY